MVITQLLKNGVKQVKPTRPSGHCAASSDILFCFLLRVVWTWPIPLSKRSAVTMQMALIWPLLLWKNLTQMRTIVCVCFPLPWAFWVPHIRYYFVRICLETNCFIYITLNGRNIQVSAFWIPICFAKIWEILFKK